MVNLTEYLTAPDFELLLRAMDYVATTYDVGDDRTRHSLETLRAGLQAHAGGPLEVSTFDLFCAIRLTQQFVRDREDAGDDADSVVGNGALSRLVYAGTRGAQFQVNNQAPE